MHRLIKFATRYLAVATIAIAAFESGSAQAANLIVNGDFSAGNTGFTTGYALTTMTPYLFENSVHGIYTVIPAGSVSGQASYGDWNNVTTDPTGGNGNVYVADAATDPNTVVWSQKIAVKANSDYTFNFYAAEISNACCSNASLAPTISGLSGNALSTTASWQQSSDLIWNSGSNTTATIALVDSNTSGPYNDFVLDDLTFKGPSPVPLPASMFALGLALLSLAGVSRFRRR